MKSNDLTPLQNIVDTFKYDEDLPDAFPTVINSSITENDFENIYDSVAYFIDEFITNNINEYKNPNFHNDLYDYIVYIFDCIFDDFTLEYNVNVLSFIKELINMYFIISGKYPRSYMSTVIIKNNANNKKIIKRLKEVDSIILPPQRSTEWYEYRYNRLTASDIWKALDSEAYRNNLILSKCLPLQTKKFERVNTESAFHKGHRYEPLSIMIYEERHNTIVGEYGCIPHKSIDFLAASPDGINIKKNNPRYGRLLEIKNPKSRKLTGIPKKDYWVQMQLQMEVMDLNECDFYETCFEEYESEEDFYKDGDSFTHTKEGKSKGVIVQFSGNNTVEYKYPPLYITKEEFDVWYDKCLDENMNMTWDKNIYWYLDDESCVLVMRNKKWFNNNLPKFESAWKDIVYDRKNGYEHRKPKKRRKAPPISKNTTTTTEQLLLGCLSYSSDDEDNHILNKKLKTTSHTNKKKKKETKNNESKNQNNNTQNKNNIVFRIRTESFDANKSDL